MKISNVTFRPLSEAEKTLAEKRWADGEFIPSGKYWLATFQFDGQTHYAGVRSGRSKNVTDLEQFQINLRVQDEAFEGDVFLPEATVADITRAVGEQFEKGEYWKT